MRNLLGRLRRSGSRSLVEQLATLTSVGDGSTLTLDFTTGVLDSRLTFTRASDATFINSSGQVQYADANWVRNSTMLVSTGWTAATVNGGTATINGDGSVTFASTAGRITWLQTLGLASGLPITFSIEVTALTAGDIRVSDLFAAGFGFGSQIYHHTNPSGVTQNNISSSAGLGTFGVGLYTVTATTTGTTNNIIFGTDCNGINRTGSVTIRNPQLQYGTVVPRRVYVPNNSTSSAKWDSARFDHDPTTLAPRGLLIEATSTNLLQQSADWTVSPWSKPAQITWDGTTYATAPDGTTSAKQITVTGGSSASIAQAVTTGTNRTISLWIRAGSLTSFSVGAFDSAGTTWGNNADSTCSIISGPGSVTQQVGGLWSITGLSTTQWTRVQIFRSTTYTNLLAYPGSSSGTINGTAYAWGFQMEAGNGASSLIPTGASQVQRLADSAVMNDIAPLNYSATNGSIYWSGIINKQPTSYITLVGFMTAIDQPAYETFGNALNYFTAARGPTLNIGGSNEVSRPYVLGSLIKYASSVNTLQDPIVAVNLNGSAGSTNKAGTGDLRVATRFVIGRQPSSTYGAEYPSVTIRSIKYWPTSKVAAELAVLTA